MKPFSLNIGGSLRQFDRPQLMAILNATPDSFYAPSRCGCNGDGDALRRRVEQIVAEGADMVDVGGYSSRPGADDVTAQEETRRVVGAIAAVRAVDAHIPVSVDTFRASVAREAVAAGADMVNDISAGRLDAQMFPTVAALGVPYIMMHMRGTPQNMHTDPACTDYSAYEGCVAAAVVAELSRPLHELSALGVADIIIDPGFGFAKTVGQNFALLRALPEVGRLLGRPLLVGLSRKSMIWRPLGLTPAEALPGTVTLNTVAVARGGAAIVRVHDVAPARQMLDLLHLLAHAPAADAPAF